MSQMVKPGYKQTEVGVIPEEWEVKTLNGLSTISRLAGAEYTSVWKETPNGEIIALRGFNIGQGNIIERDFVHISNRLSLKLKRSRLCKGDVVYPCVGSIGNAAVINEDAKYHIQQNIARITPDSTAISSDYLADYLMSSLAEREVDRFTSSSSQPSVLVGSLRQYRIPLPPTMAEQRAIATALSDMDALLAALDRLIAKQRDLKQAAMQQLLTGQTRLPGFEGEWETKRLGEVGTIRGSGVDKKLRPDETPVRLVNYMDAYRKDFIFSTDLDHWVTAPPHQLRRCAVQKGDVFFTPSSETRNDIANSAVAMEDIPDAAYSYHIVRLRLTEPWDLHFRAYAFKTKAFFDQAETICDGGGTRYVISQGKFRTMTVLVPPIPEQTAIAAVLSDIDAELAAIEQRRDKTRALKQGMMQELLTGRTRLV